MGNRLKKSTLFKENVNTKYGTETRNHKHGEISSISKGCAHILPISKGLVIGAPKINSAIGQVLVDPKNAQNKFLR